MIARSKSVAARSMVMFKTSKAQSHRAYDHFIASVNWFVGNFRGKVPIECYIRLFQSYCSTHYGSILWPLHDRGFTDFCVTWNKGVRRMLNVSNYDAYSAFTRNN